MEVHRYKHTLVKQMVGKDDPEHQRHPENASRKMLPYVQGADYIDLLGRNPRALMHISSDHRELQPLTPSHFLIGNRIVSIPPNHNMPGPQMQSTEQQLQHLSNTREAAVENFLKRWKRDYLSRLRLSHQRSLGPSPQLG